MKNCFFIIVKSIMRDNIPLHRDHTCFLGTHQICLRITTARETKEFSLFSRNVL
jgi:hypothetical protein